MLTQLILMIICSNKTNSILQGELEKISCYQESIGGKGEEPVRDKVRGPGASLPLCRRFCDQV